MANEQLQNTAKREPVIVTRNGDGKYFTGDSNNTYAFTNRVEESAFYTSEEDSQRAYQDALNNHGIAFSNDSFSEDLGKQYDLGNDFTRNYNDMLELGQTDIDSNKGLSNKFREANLKVANALAPVVKRDLEAGLITQNELDREAHNDDRNIDSIANLTENENGDGIIELDGMRYTLSKEKLDSLRSGAETSNLSDTTLDKTNESENNAKTSNQDVQADNSTETKEQKQRADKIASYLIDQSPTLKASASATALKSDLSDKLVYEATVTRNIDLEVVEETTIKAPSREFELE